MQKILGSMRTQQCSWATLHKPWFIFSPSILAELTALLHHVTSFCQISWHWLLSPHRSCGSSSHTKRNISKIILYPVVSPGSSWHFACAQEIMSSSNLYQKQVFLMVVKLTPKAVFFGAFFYGSFGMSWIFRCSSRWKPILCPIDMWQLKS